MSEIIIPGILCKIHRAFVLLYFQSSLSEITACEWCKLPTDLLDFYAPLKVLNYHHKEIKLNRYV